jgi:hypothetical protein
MGEQVATAVIYGFVALAAVMALADVMYRNWD